MNNWQSHCKKNFNLHHQSILVFLFLFFAIELFGKKKDGNTEFVVLPAPSYNEVQGFGLTLTGGLFYSFDPSDSLLNASSTFVYGFYAENTTWIGAVFQEGFFKQNKYWYSLLYATGDFKFRFYPDIPIGDRNYYINYSTQFHIIKADFLRKLKKGFYVGLQYKFSNYKTTFQLNKGDSLELPSYTENGRYSGLGPIFSFDTRDHKLTPTNGWYSNFSFLFYRNALGSDADYQTVEFDLNKYFQLSEGSILATRFYAYVGWEDIPFEQQAILGFAGKRGNDVRGYSSGRYRGSQLYDVQAEYRWTFKGRWGLVGFGSLSLVGNDADEISENGLLPAIGAGVRFNAAVDRNVNIGLDLAKGKNDYGIYFIVSEAF